MVLVLLLVGAGTSMAASREDRLYTTALQAFNDKLYSVAEVRLNQYVQNYRKSTNAPAALLFLAQAEYYLKEYGAVTNRLSDPAALARAVAAGLGDRYDYWRAEALFALGDVAAAADTFAGLSKQFPKSPLAVSAAVEAAAAYAKLGRWQETDHLLDDSNSVFQTTARLAGPDEQIANGRLLQSESKCVQQDYSAAIRALDLLTPSTLTPEQNWKRTYLLYRSHIGQNELTPALTAASNLVEIARAGAGRGDIWTTNLAESLICQARVLERLGNLDAAIAVQTNNLAAGVPAAYQQQAILKLAELALAQNNLTNAEATLENYLAAFPDSPAAPVARLTLGRLHLRDFIADPSATNQLVIAEVKLDEFLSTATNGPLVGEGYLARGWCDWLTAQATDETGDTNVVSAQEYAASFTNFLAATRYLPADSEDWAVAKFKMGDAQFAVTNYAGAITNYQAVRDASAEQPAVAASLAGRADYQILRARLALGDLSQVDGLVSQLVDRFSTNASAESGLLLAGQGFSDFYLPGHARDLFREFSVKYPNSPLRPAVEFAVARTYEREQNWNAAATNDEAWLKAHADNSLRPQVAYDHSWVVSQGGNESQAFEMFTNFVTEYPSNNLTPFAYWWIGAHYFRLGGTNLLDAERTYQVIFQDFPTNELAPPAELMAARAAIGRFNYQQAIRSYLDPLLKDANCPERLATQAKFAYCEALRGMNDTNYLANLQLATNLLSQIYDRYPTNEPGALAWCETGDCDYDMGAYDAATNAYAQVLTFPSVSVPLRNRAEVGMAVVLKKKAEGLPPDDQRPLLSLALQFCTDVLYTREAVADEFWTKEAGIQALPLMMTLKEGDVNRFFDRLEHWLPQAKDALEKKRASLGD
jgi:TolA-binding protein